MNGQSNQAVVITVEPDAPLALYAPDPRAAFAQQFQAAIAISDAARRLQWREMEDAWLDAKFRKSNSQHTIVSYRRRLRCWQEFLSRQVVHDEAGPRPTELWEVDHWHVRAWMEELRSLGRLPTTINHHVACVSSYYSFVIHEKRLIQGVEIDLFVDRLGNARMNPFRTGNIPRATEESSRAYPLTLAEYDALLSHLEANAHTLAGARNYALILTYLHTGWRSAELLRMRWGEIRPVKSSKKMGFVFAWRGKGGKVADDALPVDCYNAIVAFLKKAGRILPGHPADIGDGEYIWLPVAAPVMSGLSGEPRAEAGRPISDKSALRILRSAAKHAGIRCWETLRVHDLRHTHAALLLATHASAVEIRDRLHHSNIATTDRYVRTVHRGDPVDRHSGKFRQLRLSLADEEGEE